MLIQSQQPFYNTPESQNMKYNVMKVQICLISDAWLSWWFALPHTRDFILWKKQKILNGLHRGACGLWYCTLGLGHLRHGYMKVTGIVGWLWEGGANQVGEISFHSFKSYHLLHVVIAAIMRSNFRNISCY